MTKDEKKIYQKNYQKNYRLKNRDKLNLYKRKYYRKHKEKIQLYQKKYNKNYQLKNRDKYNLYKRKYYRKHKEKIQLYQKKYNKKINYSIQKKKANEFNEFIQMIKKHYKCMNPDCKWQGELPQCCLDFHHIKKRKYHISQMTTHSIKTISEEINKCTLLCAICHRLATYDDLDCSLLHLCNLSKDGNPL